MKRILITTALFAAIGAMTETSAQNIALMGNSNSNNDDNDKDWHVRPHRGKKNNLPFQTVTTYDAASTVLTVKFPSNSQGGTVEVYRNGAKVAGVTANSGTTFSCKLREYGTGNYNVVVYSGNTVIDSKNYTVK